MHAQMKDVEVDESLRQQLAQQIRLSRASLGSILEWLETSEIDPELATELQTYIENVGVEVDELIEALPDILKRTLQ
jgi:hypothetical protein